MRRLARNAIVFLTKFLSQPSRTLAGTGVGMGNVSVIFPRVGDTRGRQDE